jgi:hypothetical protein
MNSESVSVYLNAVKFNPTQYLKSTNLCGDFEFVSINAITNVYENIEIMGCHFQYTKVIWYWIQSNGLVAHYKENNLFQNFVKKFGFKLVATRKNK